MTYTLNAIKYTIKQIVDFCFKHEMSGIVWNAFWQSFVPIGALFKRNEFRQNFWRNRASVKVHDNFFPQRLMVSPQRQLMEYPVYEIVVTFIHLGWRFRKVFARFSKGFRKVFARLSLPKYFRERFARAEQNSNQFLRAAGAPAAPRRRTGAPAARKNW